MALSAVGPHLALVNIIVAILAVLAHVGEHRFDVACGTFHLFMHAAQGIFRFVVIKFWNRADRSPARSGMAVFTRDGKVAVWAPGGLALWRFSGGSSRRPQEQEQPAEQWSENRRNCPLN